MPALPPLPDSQPVAVNALRNKRAEIAGEIAMHSREIDRLRVLLMHLDATMLLFDPGTDPTDIPALLRHPKRMELFAHGEITERIYEALRHGDPISPREVAYAAIEAKGIVAPDRTTKRDIAARFAKVVYDLTKRGQLVKSGHGPSARWRLPPREPDLI